MNNGLHYYIEYYIAMIRELQPCTTTGINLTSLSERSQTQPACIYIKFNNKYN